MCMHIRSLFQLGVTLLQVKVTQTIEGSDLPTEVRTLVRGCYFGEKALLRSERLCVSVRVECVSDAVSRLSDHLYVAMAMLSF